MLARSRGERLLLVGEEPTLFNGADGVGVVERERSLPLLLERERVCDFERRRKRSLMAITKRTKAEVVT